MATTALSVVLKEIESRREQIGIALMGGGAKDFAEYKSLCGEIRGLSQAHMYVTDLVRNLEQDEDE
jgi:hypothetical protein